MLAALESTLAFKGNYAAKKDPGRKALASIFLLNNYYFIYATLKTSPLGAFVDDVESYMTKVEQQRDDYIARQVQKDEKAER